MPEDHLIARMIMAVDDQRHRPLDLNREGKTLIANQLLVVRQIRSTGIINMLRICN